MSYETRTFLLHVLTKYAELMCYNAMRGVLRLAYITRSPAVFAPRARMLTDTVE